MHRRSFFGALAAGIVGIFAAPALANVTAPLASDILDSGNPADVYLRVLTGPHNARPIPIERIDMEVISRWRDECAARGDFVAVSRKPSTMAIVLGRVAAAGQMRYGMLEGKWTVVPIHSPKIRVEDLSFSGMRLASQ